MTPPPSPSPSAFVAKPLIVGAHGVDSYPFSQAGTAAQAGALKNAGFEFLSLYLGVASATLATVALEAGLSIYGVTVANNFDGRAAATWAGKLGLVQGTSLFLDVEGQAAYQTPPATLISKINAWADDVKTAGYLPGVYVGSPQPLTSEELWKLRVQRYWRASSRIADRNGHLAEPNCGWCMIQAWPSVTRAGVFVDVDFVTEDYLGRLPVGTSKLA